jgi:hypothetical protein
MTDMNRTARAAAFWMVQGAALSLKLRAHGRVDEAENLDHLLGEVSQMMSAECGRPSLMHALDWASSQLWQPDVLPASTARH